MKGNHRRRIIRPSRRVVALLLLCGLCLLGVWVSGLLLAVLNGAGSPGSAAAEAPTTASLVLTEQDTLYAGGRATTFTHLRQGQTLLVQIHLLGFWSQCDTIHQGGPVLSLKQSPRAGLHPGDTRYTFVAAQPGIRQLAIACETQSLDRPVVASLEKAGIHLPPGAWSIRKLFYVTILVTA